jgi:hypothetical protein
VYLEVVPITGDPAHPQLGGHGPAIDFAVKMRQFSPGAVAGERPAALISGAEIDALAALLAAFHQGLPAATLQPWGTPESVWQPIADSLAQIASIRPGGELAAALAAIHDVCSREYASNCGLIAARRANGYVRECHGDLHLGNLVRLGDRLVPFDALEFDPALRWIDVLSEVAFLMMDLEVHDRGDLAIRFLNRYLSITGDYQGLPVLPLFLSYRALVRAKVRLLDPGSTPGRDSMITRLLDYASRPFSDQTARMILMCGVAGSGKTVLAAALATHLRAIHLRSDVERKRLAKLPELARTGAEPDTGIYTAEMSRHTYVRLAQLAQIALGAGFSVVVDAANLRRAQRQSFVNMANQLGVTSSIVHCHAPTAELIRRVCARSAAGADASEAGTEVLRLQLARIEPPMPDEADALFGVDTTASVDAAALSASIAAVPGEPPGATRPASPR